MRLYYYIYHITRGKEYKFSFSYIKGEYESIAGNAEVCCKTDKKIIRFDPDSNRQLNDIEKHIIVTNVMKHVV
ncbi:MAG: hypothetical protein N2489_09450 [Clostridia bacterium]|nr:hypothetical protein [Clostridia bacterium]